MDRDTFYGETSTIFSSFDPIPVIKEFTEYDILEEIGRGGMGVIYKAREKSTDTIIALKILLVKHNTYDEDIKRFQREAKFTIQLEHPNIIKTHSIGVIKGNYYIITDFLKGQTLQERMLRNPVTTYEACHFVTQIAKGLEYAHRKGILHRDLKPANIMLTRDDEVKILDFGLAKHVDSSTRLTLTGTVLGTPAYMSPEQAGGDSDLISVRSDIYSLGVILYEMLTGRTPFQAESSIQMLKKIIDKEPRPIRKIRKDIPIKLEIIIARCLEKQSRYRYASMAEFRSDIQAFVGNHPIQARKRGRFSRFYEHMQKHKRMVALVAILFVNFLLALTALHLHHIIKEKRLQEEALRNIEKQTPKWEPFLIDRFEAAAEQAWYARSRNWKLDQYTISGKTPLVLPLQDETNSLLRFSAKSEGRRISYLAGFDPRTRKGIRIIFRLGAAITPETVTGIEVHRDNILIARNYRTNLLPGRYNAFQIKIEDSRISVMVNGKTVVFFDGIMPLKLSSIPFTLDPHGERLELSSLELYCKKRRPKSISGDDFFRDQMYEKALSNYLRITRDHSQLNAPVAREARFKAGLCLERLERHEEAVEIFEKFTPVDKEFYPRALCHVWLGHIRSRDTAKAEALYARIKEDFSLYEMLNQIPFNTLFTIFQFYQQEAERRREFLEAAQLYEKAIDTANFLGLENEAFDSRNRIAEGYLKLGQTEKALGEFRRAQAEYPELTTKRAWNQMKIAETYRLQNNTTASANEYQKLIMRYKEEAGPRSWALVWLAEIALMENNPAKAQTLCASPQITEALPRLGAEILGNNRGLPDIESVDPYFRNDLLYLKAMALLQRHKKEEAADVLQQALLSGRENDWPEALIRHQLNTLALPEDKGGETPVF